MNKLNFQRDEFINQIYLLAKKNKSINFISIDFGAPALDRYRKDLKKQFIHLGICEQNAIDFACGLALEGKVPYVYAMAPFLSSRCLEQHKVSTCLMDLNVTTILTGIGLSYANSGPTHYSTEDLACIRSIANSNIFTASDPETAKMLAKYTYKIKKPKFIRLDRKSSYNLSRVKVNEADIKKGFRYLRKGKAKKIILISHGTIIERAVKSIDQMNNNLKKNITIVDLIRCKPFPKILVNIIKKYKRVITLDEQNFSGGLASIIFESANCKNIIPLSLPDKFIYENLGREKLLDKYGLSIKRISSVIKNQLK